MTIGTNNNDTITTSITGDAVSGLDGDDSLDSTTQINSLFGGDGDDTLTSTAASVGGASVFTHLGGDGNDQSTITLNGGAAAIPSFISTTQDGGLGNDTITLNVTTPSGGQDITSNAFISGATGNDNVDANLSLLGTGNTTSSLVIDTAVGADNITKADAKAISLDSGLVTTNVYADLGASSDSIDTFALSQTDGDVSSSIDVIGAGGADLIVATSFSGVASAAGGDHVITQNLDGGNAADTITSYVDTDFGNNPINSADIDVLLDGGTGADVISSTIDAAAETDVDISLTINAGDGLDSVTIDQDSDVFSNGIATSDILNTIDLGNGNDTLSADMDINQVVGGSLLTTVTSSLGVNEIDMSSRVLADSSAFTTNTVTTGNNADKIDLATWAFVASTGSANPTNIADARNTVNSGGGSDVINVQSQAQSSGDGSGGAGTGFGAYAQNVVSAGTGADSIASGTYIFSDSNDGTGRGFVNLDGGNANDTITSDMSSDFSELFEVEMQSFIDGGSQADVINSSIDGFARNIIDVDNDILGGAGSDSITSMIFTESFGSAAMDVTDDIDGGDGNDTITATMDHSQSPTTTGTAIGNVLGGTGNDQIIATTVGHLGSYDVNGQAGNDLIMVSGGGNTFVEQNILRGDAGDDTLKGSDGIDLYLGGEDEDRLVASAGNDFLFGGLGADTFAFAAADQEGNQFSDWDRTEDILQFIGLVDTGPAGLVDDIDATITSISDAGVGNTVSITFTSGTEMYFIGQGTGSISSIGDLVDDATTQLIA